MRWTSRTKYQCVTIQVNSIFFNSINRIKLIHIPQFTKANSWIPRPFTAWVIHFFIEMTVAVASSRVERVGVTALFNDIEHIVVFNTCPPRFLRF